MWLIKRPPLSCRTRPGWGRQQVSPRWSLAQSGLHLVRSVAGNSMTPSGWPPWSLLFTCQPPSSGFRSPRAANSARRWHSSSLTPSSSCSSTGPGPSSCSTGARRVAPQAAASIVIVSGQEAADGTASRLGLTRRRSGRGRNDNGCHLMAASAAS